MAAFHRLCEQLPERRLERTAGTDGWNGRLERNEGEMLMVITKGSRPTAMAHRLAHRLARALAGPLDASGSALRHEAPLDLGEHQEAEPDLALVSARFDAWWQAQATPADPLLGDRGGRCQTH